MTIEFDEIRPMLVDQLPKSVRRAIREGDTHDECQDFSEEVLKVLLENGADAIIVQSRDRDGTPLHHFVLRMTSDYEAVMIDPTVSQFYHHDRFKKIFIGSREDLREQLCDSAHSTKLFNEYWPERLYVYEPEGVYEELGVKPPSETPKREFQDKWSSYGVKQDDHFVDLISKNGIGKRKSTKPEETDDYQGSGKSKSRSRF